MSPLGTECLDIFSPPPGAREVMTQVERLSSRDTKIALRSGRIAACSCGRGKRACMVAPAWVVQHGQSAREQGATNRARGIFGLPPGPTKGQAQQVSGFDRHVRVVAWPAPLTSPGRMPGRERLGRDPDCEAAPLLQRPVVLWPVADLVARPGDLVAARLMGLVGHRASGKR